MRRAAIAGGGAAAALMVAAAVAALGGGSGTPPAAAAAPAAGATGTVERRDLVDRDTLDGTLGYAAESTLAAGASGTLTRLRDPGAVVRRGQWLYDVDGAHAAWLLYGRLPAWRDFAPGMTDGSDVRQLERNLRALGADPGGDMDVDDHWDWATTAAVVRLQGARDLIEDGTLGRGELVFRAGAARVGAAIAAAGDPVAPGRAIGKLSSTERRVTVALAADRQRLAREGDRVSVELPTGRTGRGRITEVGAVVQPPAQEGDDPTITVTIALTGKAARGGLDQAPVDVGFAVERRKDVLTVPVKALLARDGGRFAVEVADGGARRLVDVTPGLYADGRVEVDGELQDGQTVVTAR